ncbi:hypothetical protein [Stenotrophomonas sp. YIM B06876]|uniref:hypothetical protein n=1 Tax=Stenotrophomonas sp. YIM B06876 TaxID=3060211 RepID=UPI002739B883|nr:hypothetical protein [Stenotrophomonas sp. YIM B06876]
MTRKPLTVWLLSGAGVLALGGAAVRTLTALDGHETFSGILFGMAAGLLFAALLRRLMPDGCAAAPPALRKRYTREVTLAMAGYGVLLVLSIWLLKRVDGTVLRALIALLPVPPIVLMLRAMIRYIRDADELQQRIELEAVSFATALISLIYLTGGFLQSAKVIDVPSHVAMIWVFPLVCLAYGLAKAVVARRYQ